MGSVSTNIGMLLQKLDFILHAKRVEQEVKRALEDDETGDQASDSDVDVTSSHWQWKFGFFLFILGQILNAIALSFAAQSMLATLGAFSLVSNTLFAPCLLHEELSWLHVFSMFLIIAGASIVVLNSSHSEHNFTATELEKLYYRPSFIILISFIVAAVFLVLLYRWYLRKFKHGKPLPGPLYAFLAAVFGSLSVLFSKSTAQLVKQTCQGDNQFDEPLTWIVIFLTLVCGALSVRALNEGLQSNTKALFLIPLYFVLALIGQVSGGASYFGDFDHMTWKQCLIVLSGVSLTVTGVFISSLYDSRSDEVVKLEDLGVDLKSQKSNLDEANQSNDFAVNELSPLAVESKKKSGFSRLSRVSSLPAYGLDQQESKELTRRNSSLLLDKNNGGHSTRSLIRRASIVKFSLHPEAYAESFRRKKRTRGGSRTALETIVDDASSVNTYGTSGQAAPRSSRDSFIRRNDNYFMTTQTYGTDVPGSYRLEDDGSNRSNRTRNSGKSKRRYSVSVLPGFGVA